MTDDPRWVRLLLRLYPRGYRERHAGDLEATIRGCIDRERRAGTPTAFTAARLALDAVGTSVAIRAPHQPRSGDPLMHALTVDLRYAFRLLRRAPLFSALTIATLALAIGANTAIFSVVNGVLLRQLPYADSDRLLLLYQAISPQAPPFGFSAPDFVAFQQGARSYDGLAAYQTTEFELSGVDMPERITAAKVGAPLFDVLGVRPALGRPFSAEEDAGRQPVAILTDGLWRRKFGADPAIVGKSVVLDRRAYTIVGVTPPLFTFPNRGPHMNNVPAEVFVPISFSRAELTAFGSMYNKTAIGRLKPGVTREQAASEAMLLVKQAIAGIYPAELNDLANSIVVRLSPLRDEVVGNIRRVLYLLLAAVAMVLLIACADIACLTLTRTAAREREMAIRTAVGASRGRVMRLIFIETGVLAGIGAAAGLALAWWGHRALLAAAPAGIPRAQDITFDTRVLLFTAAAAIASALICGVLPAYEAARRDSGGTLKESGRTSTSSSRQRRIFAVLVTAQFAGAVVLVSAGGLLIRSFIRVSSIDPGFDAGHVVSFATSLPGASYSRGSDVRAFYRELIDRARRIPGVRAVGAATDLPLTVRDRRAFTVENPSSAAAPPSAPIANDLVTGDYFSAIGSRVVSGRALNDNDTVSSEPVVVVNQTLARRYWPGEDPVGRRVAWGNPRTHGPWMRVVGVIADIKQAGLAAETEPATWQPWAQMPDATLGTTVTGLFRSLRLMVRTDLPPSALVPAVRAEIRALDSALPVTDVMTLEEIVGESTAAQRFNAALLGGFAGVALLLCTIGIGGVLAISVSRRTQEIGIRLALGAARTDVVRMVVRQGMILVAVGIAIGLPCALVSARLLRSLLFQTAPDDVVALGTGLALLCAVALMACAVPALRASRVSPVRALRMD